MPVSRSMAALSGIAVLGLALTACDDQANGQIVAHNGERHVETVSNLVIGGCHRFPEGVTRVDNYTTSSLIMYSTPDCTVPRGGESVYLDGPSSDNVVGSAGLWRSFSFAPE
ncbi:hypothetical protein JK361_26440 [Streptomyces sp. 5-8]|uniref:Lipoprotein n=1 Tax=Streptomyces musisoli TaxID=2802280 RepID=A0ABS1P6T6_9ACTN|nr:MULTISPECIES: hypothetical protein [Streptomyces]MBL1108087.1 hypothetical protein [Streptomyces musisoli]MBY8841451.1 hypothetical protein [Streptomyces sp. SP2-10]